MMQVIFAEVWWIGTAEENPTEQQLPMPAELQTEKLHEEAAYQLPGASFVQNAVRVAIYRVASKYFDAISLSL